MIDGIVSDMCRRVSAATEVQSGKEKRPIKNAIPKTDVYIPVTDEMAPDSTQKKSKQLTNQMVDTLAQKYDVQQMTRKEYGGLLRELRDMGVISSQEFSVGYGGEVPSAGASGEMVAGLPLGEQQADFAKLLQSCQTACRDFVLGQETGKEQKVGTSFLDAYAHLSEVFQRIEAAAQQKGDSKVEINRIFGQQMAQSYQQRTARTAQGSSFQEILQARAATEPAQVKTSTVAVNNDTTILPTDSVEVKLEKLKKIGETADYTGMSYSEIYTTIWNRYNDAFDGNLSAILSPISAVPMNWSDIANQFRKETYKLIFQPLRQEFEEQGRLEGGEFYDKDDTYIMQCISDIRSAPLGYSGMSFAEKEQAIYEKYKGKNTYIDFLSMQGELFSTGVYRDKLGREGESNYIFVLDTNLTYKYLYPKENVPLSTSNPDWTDAQWNRILHEEFDAHSFLKGVKESLSDITFPNNDYHFDMESVISEQIEELIHATEREEESQKL